MRDDGTAGLVWGGVVLMTEAVYDALAAALPVPLLERRAQLVPLSRCTGGDRKAVYVAVTAGGYACYVGQAQRPPDILGAAARRLANHRSEPSKGTEWVGYWVLPLPNNTTKPLLNDCERTVAGILGVPLRNRRWRGRQRAVYGTA